MKLNCIELEDSNGNLILADLDVLVLICAGKDWTMQDVEITLSNVLVDGKSRKDLFPLAEEWIEKNSEEIVDQYTSL